MLQKRVCLTLPVEQKKSKRKVSANRGKNKHRLIQTKLRRNKVHDKGNSETHRVYSVYWSLKNFNSKGFRFESRTTVSQDVQTRSSVQLAFAKFLYKIKDLLNQCQYHGYNNPSQISLLFYIGIQRRSTAQKIGFAHSVIQQSQL